MSDFTLRSIAFVLTAALYAVLLAAVNVFTGAAPLSLVMVFKGLFAGALVAVVGQVVARMFKGFVTDSLCLAMSTAFASAALGLFLMYSEHRQVDLIVCLLIGLWGFLPALLSSFVVRSAAAGS